MPHGPFDSQIAGLRAWIDALSKIAQGNGTPVAEAIAGLRTALGWGWRYGLAIAAVAAAMGLRLAMTAWVGPGLSAYISFYPAIMIVALLAGIGPGLLATALASLVSAHWILPPVGQFASASPVDRLGLVVFAAMGAFMSVVAHLCRRNRDKATAYDRDSALRESQARLSTFAEATFEGIAESEAGRIVDCNEQLARILGCSVAELRGAEIAQFIAPEDRDRAMANIRPGRDSAIEHVALRKDGTRIVVEVHGRLLSPGGPRRLTVIRDITERKQAEEMLRQQYAEIEAIYDSAGVGLAVIDRELRYVRINRRMAEMNGIAAEQHLGRTVREMVPDLSEQAEATLRRIIETGEPMRDVEVAGTTPAQPGLRRTWVEQWMPLKDAQGRVIGINVSAVEVTHERQVQSQLKAAKSALEHANAAKDQFIAKLSHELRTPLTPVVASLSALARDGRLPEDLRDDMKLIERNIGLEVHLINDLLDVTRIVSGKMELRREPLDVAAVLREVGQIVATDLDAKGQTLAIDTPGAPYWTDADRARLHQVFWNLLKNAIKFSPNGARISMDAAPADGIVRIAVSDAGQGIDPADLPRLFRAFEQGGAGQSFGGLGLGLAICKGVVDLHGGSIAATSEGKGQGATFTVELPLVKSAELKVLSAKSGDISALGTQHSPLAGPLHILLVEDHEDSARIMRRLLMAEDHHVTWAASVKDALAAAQTGGFDVVVSDIGLPDGTGYDLMRQIIAAGKKLKGIAVSGYGTVEDVQRALAAGFAEHVTKPVSFDSLHNALLRVTNEAAQPTPPS